MNDTFDKKHFNGLAQNFTTDAWQLSKSFLQNLEEKFNQFNIPYEKQKSTLNGIIEYIQDFVEDFKGISKINYLETLGLLKVIGSPSEILQALDIPLEQSQSNDGMVVDKDDMMTISKTNNAILCRGCGWFNEFDSNYCDNCGINLLKQKDIQRKEVLPSIMFSYPNVMSILLSSFILIPIGLIQALIFFFVFFETEGDVTITVLMFAGILVMLIPSIVIGIILGRIIESSNKNQKSVFSSLRSPASSILFSFIILFAIAIVDGLVIFLIEADEDPSWFTSDLLPAAIFVMIVPAVIIGILFSYLNNNLYYGSSSTLFKQKKEIDEVNYLILELFENPYPASILLCYLILLIVSVLTFNFPISPFFKTGNLIDPETYYNGLQDISAVMITPAVILGIAIGYIITILKDENFAEKKQLYAHFVKIQEKLSLGIILGLISLWLIFIYLPITITVSEITVLSFLLILISFIGSFWIHKWNVTKQPINIAYLTFQRKTKVIEPIIYSKIKKINIIGGVFITFIVIGIWGNLMTWSFFTLPAWIVLIISFIILMNGLTLMYYFSWYNINRLLNRFVRNS